MSNLLQIQRPEITDTQRLLNITQRIKGMTANSYQELCNIQKQGVDMVWNNNFFQPQVILDALGTDAGKIFQYHGALTNYVVALATAEGVEPDIKLPTNAFTINEDGTITVLPEPYDPSA